METASVFSIASDNAQWLSARQVAVAGNIANANVPSYKAVDTVSFAETLANESGKLAATNANHMSGKSVGSISMQSSDRRVSLEEELVKSAEVRSKSELNTAIVSSFHRMILMTVKA